MDDKWSGDNGLVFPPYLSVHAKKQRIDEYETLHKMSGGPPSFLPSYLQCGICFDFIRRLRSLAESICDAMRGGITARLFLP